MSPIRTRRVLWFVCAAASLLAACSTTPPRTAADVLATAEAYRWHRWIPSHANVLHGPDRDGVLVNTPDSSWRPGTMEAGFWHPNVPAVGIPYQWGGFSTPEDFDRGVDRGLAAGDVFTEQKRALLHKGVSREAVGVDCSGLISRCWGLRRHHSTRELPQISRSIEWHELLPGDILNRHNDHVLLFAKWYDPGKDWFLAYQASTYDGQRVVCSLIETSRVRAAGYQPLRYLKMRTP